MHIGNHVKTNKTDCDSVSRVSNPLLPARLKSEKN